MTITIDGKNYDENKLDKKVVNSIGQIAILQKRMNDIQMDHENAKVLLAHHQKNVKDNLSDEALEEEKKEETKAE
jgi:hypothetical protein|tara:strand:- start:584 stop:808 length:225 start_codon:yes stop_codon:yes gene_type:complete